MADLLELIGLKDGFDDDFFKTFITRLKPAAYTGPQSGERIELRYSERLDKNYGHRLDGYSYNGINGVHYQDLGLEGEVYPMICHLSGIDYDLQSKKFERILSEIGTGTLEHPVHGRKPVVVGKIKRTDDPINQGGVGFFVVEFFRNLELAPTGVANAEDLSNQFLETANEASQSEFANLVLETASDIANFKDNVLGSLTLISNALTGVISGIEGKLAEFNRIKRDIENNINTIVNFPENLAAQYQIMVQLVNGSSTTEQALFALSDAIILNTDFDIDVPSNANLNKVLNAEVISGACLNSASIVSQRGTYETKTQTFEAIGRLNDLLNATTETLDLKQEPFEDTIFQKQYFSQIDSYQEIIKLATNVKGDLQQRAFNLAIERSFTTKREYALLELAYLLYGDVSDETLEFLTKTNSIEGNELYVIGVGREILFYR